MTAGPLSRRAVLPGIIVSLLILSPIALVTATAPQTVTSSMARAATPPQAPEFSGCGGVNQPVVNAERANNSLPPYKRVTALDEAARYHSADMGQDNYFDHDTYDRVGGNLVYICDTWTRIDQYYSGAMGENIAAGYSTPEDVMNGWMTVSKPPGTTGSPHRIDLTLHVIDAPLDYNYLPAMLR